MHGLLSHLHLFSDDWIIILIIIRKDKFTLYTGVLLHMEGKIKKNAKFAALTVALFNTLRTGDADLRV